MTSSHTTSHGSEEVKIYFLTSETLWRLLHCPAASASVNTCTASTGCFMFGSYTSCFVTLYVEVIVDISNGHNSKFAGKLYMVHSFCRRQYYLTIAGYQKSVIYSSMHFH